MPTPCEISGIIRNAGKKGLARFGRPPLIRGPENSDPLHPDIILLHPDFPRGMMPGMKAIAATAAGINETVIGGKNFESLPLDAIRINRPI